MKISNREEKNRKRSRGFTLVELMIVIVIMVILAAAAVPLFGGYAQRAKDSKSIAECRQVVQAAQVKANDLYAAGVLKIEGNLDKQYQNEIIILANVKGKILSGPFVETDSKVIFLRYECENGVIVRYDIRENPAYAVEEGETAYTRVENWIKKSEDWKKEWLDENPGKTTPGRDVLIEMASKDELLKVDPTYTTNTPFSDTDQFWRPYYIGSMDSGLTVLYSADSKSGVANWRGYLVYVEGEIYVSTKTHDYSGKPEGANVAGLKDAKTYEDVNAWLLANGFRLKK